MNFWKGFAHKIPIRDMKKAEQRIEEAVNTLRMTDFPTQVILELSAGCNLACPACPTHVLQRRRGLISQDVTTKVIDEIADANPHTELYVAFMGEALLHPRFFDIIGYAVGRGLDNIILNTNATLLDGTRRQRLVASNIRRIIVSIDGASAQTYEARRVKGSYDEVRDNTIALLDLARRTPGAPETWVQMIIDDGNIHEEEAFKSFWLDHGATTKIRPQLSWGGRVGSGGLMKLEVERVPCPWLMRQIIVTCEGEFAMCDADHEARLELGNVGRKTVREIWNGPLREARERHFAGDYSHPLCRVCDDWKVGKSEVFHPDRERAAS